MAEQLDDDYGLSKVVRGERVAAPELPYRPHDPEEYRPRIGLIGCGGISAQHLSAYAHAGYDIAALCDRNEHKARDRQKKYFPDADIYTDYHDLLKRDDIEVVDLLPHPRDRLPMLEAALHAGKHVLSQKPFVTNLDDGMRLVELAERQGVRLAVNQNGRWAPHFAYLRQAVTNGIIGKLTSAALTVHWDHSWIIGTAFEDVHDLVLYDFGIHWFDIVSCFFDQRQPQSVCASTSYAANQQAKPPMLGHVVVDYEDAQATLVFNATVVYGQEDRTFLAGTKGSVISSGPSLSEQAVTLYTEAGTAIPQLEGTWFREGFHGTMAELLCAIKERREPYNSAHSNLKSLALAFAAIASAHEGMPKRPGDVRTLPSANE
jgi:predicted dehydrogenase